MQEAPAAPKTSSEDRARQRKRRQAAMYRRRRLRFALGFIGACVLIVVVIVVAAAVSNSSSQLSEEQLLAGGSRSPTAPVSATGEARPAFARFGNKPLLLPVSAADATIIAYQPVSDNSALPLTPIGQKVNANAFVRFFRSLFGGEAAVRYFQLKGEEGEPTTSVLVGAPPDSPVTTPISGVVVGVTPYKLFGRFDDYRIDIRPEETGGLTVTLLFVDKPVVKIGERVTAGKTQLGTVRLCPEEVGKTLAEYTHDTGSHVYLQVSEEPIG